MMPSYTLSPRAERLDEWLRPVVRLVQEEQTIGTSIRVMEETADEYDGDDLDAMIASEQKRLELCRKRLTWYRTRVLRMIEDADWKCKTKPASQKLRATAINRFYRGLPLAGNSTSLTCADQIDVSVARIMQLRVDALNRMAEVWREEPPCPY